MELGSKKYKYDLEDRTKQFSKNIVLLCTTLKKDVITLPIINQLIRSATSIGANYMEANEASSKKDFRNKIRISLKEANETKYWLEILCVAVPEKMTDCKKYGKESHELVLIFSKIARSCDDKD